jgi:hypothetical protein
MILTCLCVTLQQHLERPVHWHGGCMQIMRVRLHQMTKQVSGFNVSLITNIHAGGCMCVWGGVRREGGVTSCSCAGWIPQSTQACHFC